MSTPKKTSKIMKPQSDRHCVLMTALLAILCLNGARVEAAEPEMVDVFVSGTNGYHTYCIPALIATPKGTLLAFCEGRKYRKIDEAPADLVLRRSIDGGKTWLPMQVIVKAVPEAAMDPTLVIDRDTGVIIMMYDLFPEYIKDTWPANYHRPSGLGRDSVTTWLATSSDEGATWSTPIDITAMAKKPEWTVTIHGEGLGIQTRSGRLVIPCSALGQTFVNYSDDHGKTWKISDNGTGPSNCEVQMVELTNGTLLLNIRSGRRKGCRAGAISSDGGKTWGEMFDIPELPDEQSTPGCHASILRYTWADQQGGRSRILFSNPASTQGRKNGTVRLSYDEAKTWPVAKVLNKDSFAYSCLAVLPDGTICCLFDHADWSKTIFARFSLEWLTDGKDSLKPPQKCFWNRLFRWIFP